MGGRHSEEKSAEVEPTCNTFQTCTDVSAGMHRGVHTIWSSFRSWNESNLLYLSAWIPSHAHHCFPELIISAMHASNHVGTKSREIAAMLTRVCAEMTFWRNSSNSVADRAIPPVAGLTARLTALQPSFSAPPPGCLHDIDAEAALPTRQAVHFAVSTGADVISRSPCELRQNSSMPELCSLRLGALRNLASCDDGELFSDSPLDTGPMNVRYKACFIRLN